MKTMLFVLRSTSGQLTVSQDKPSNRHQKALAVISGNTEDQAQRRLNEYATRNGMKLS